MFFVYICHRDFVLLAAASTHENKPFEWPLGAFLPATLEFQGTFNLTYKP